MNRLFDRFRFFLRRTGSYTYTFSLLVVDTKSGTVLASHRRAFDYFDGRLVALETPKFSPVQVHAVFDSGYLISTHRNAETPLSLLQHLGLDTSPDYITATCSVREAHRFLTRQDLRDAGLDPSNLADTLIAMLRGIRAARSWGVYTAPSTSSLWGDCYATALKTGGPAGLAERVARVIRDEDSDDISELIDTLNHGLYDVTAQRIVESINARCGITIVQASACGHYCLDDETHRIGGRWSSQTVCDVCFGDEDIVVYCDDDNNYHLRGDVYYWESDGCYHLSEETCEDDEEDEDSDEPDRLLDYSTDVLRHLDIDPTFVTSSSGDFHMGLELETVLTDYDESRHERVYSVRRELGGDYVVGKADGSIGDRGIEWVTRPTSLSVHIDKLSSWERTASGLRAWDEGSCGLHVHIDAGAFTKLSLGKMLQFFNRKSNASFIRQIAGRHPKFDSQAMEYAGWDVLASIAEKGPIKTLKAKAQNASRYRMINLTNVTRRQLRRLGLEGQGDYTTGSGAGTVEIRVFRASMKKARLLAQVEFAHAIVCFCRVASWNKLDGDSFKEWLKAYGARYRNLRRWYGINAVKVNPKAAPAPKATDETVDLVAA